MTNAPTRVLLSWSSGKDSAWSLYVLRRDPAVEVVGLLTTVTADYDRVSMHAVRRALLERQAEAAGLPLWPVEIPAGCSDEQYRSIIGTQVEKARVAGVQEIAFGDLFLPDVREYRERMMAGTGVGTRFPLWPMRESPADTRGLAREMQSVGLRAYVTCIDPRCLDASFAGRAWDASFLADLPPDVDPCGENGEFHTFVVAGPMLSSDVAVRPGEVVLRDGFVFADLLPA